MRLDQLDHADIATPGFASRHRTGTRRSRLVPEGLALGGSGLALRADERARGGTAGQSGLGLRAAGGAPLHRRALRAAATDLQATGRADPVPIVVHGPAAATALGPELLLLPAIPRALDGPGGPQPICRARRDSLAAVSALARRAADGARTVAVCVHGAAPSVPVHLPSSLSHGAGRRPGIRSVPRQQPPSGRR